MCWETFYSFTKLSSQYLLRCKFLLRVSDGDSACEMHDGRSEWRSPLEPPLEPPLERDLVWISRHCSALVWIVARVKLLHTTSPLHRDMKVTTNTAFYMSSKTDQRSMNWPSHLPPKYLVDRKNFQCFRQLNVTTYFHFRWVNPCCCNVCLVCH